MTTIITFYTYNTVEAQRSQIRHAFGQYLAPALVEQLAQSPEKLVLGGEEREMTILMSDVRGFTTISESYKDDPQGLTSLMNRLLTPLTNTIVSHEGTIDKYIGDAIMGFWNAPLDVKDHELKACAAALDMIDRLEALNESVERGSPAPARQSCHFASASGSTQVDALSAISDLTFVLTIQFSAIRSTLLHVWRARQNFTAFRSSSDRELRRGPEEFAILELDLITVKGKTEAQTIYALLGREEIASGSDFQELRKLWSTMLYCYRSRDWDGALEAIELCQSAEHNFDLMAF